MPIENQRALAILKLTSLVNEATDGYLRNYVMRDGWVLWWAPAPRRLEELMVTNGNNTLWYFWKILNHYQLIYIFEIMYDCCDNYNDK